jgi:ArsR family transcriptional regulator
MFCKSYNEFFQTLANPTNQFIIDSLLKGEKSVTEIVNVTKLEQSKVSHALKRLAECKLVNAKQIGKQRIYELNKDTIIPILEIADKHAKELCPVCPKVKHGNK